MSDAPKKAAFTPGPWSACGSERGGCQCGMIWSRAVDVPIATAIIGKWGDEYPELDIVDDGPSIGRTVTIKPKMEMIEYGSIDEATGKANAQFISAAPDLYEALEDLVSDAERQMANPSHHMPFSFQKALAALAKARGEA